MHAVKCRLGYTTMAINNFVIIVEESEERVNGMGKTGVLLRATPLGSLQWEQLSVLSLFLSVPSASWQAQTAGMWGCSVLLFAGLRAPGPGLLLGVQFRLGWAGLHCTTLHSNAMHWPIVVSAALGGKRSRSLAPQQGMAAPSCVRRWWLPDGGWRERRRGPLLSPSYSVFILSAFILSFFACILILFSCKAFFLYHIYLSPPLFLSHSKLFS